MGLFDFFKKKNEPTEKQRHQAPEKKADEQIEIISVDNGGHGDNFGGLMGFHFLNSEAGKQLINELIALSGIKPAVMKNDAIQVKEIRFGERNGTSNHLGIRMLETPNQIISAYPYLNTDYEIPFETKQIQEWSHVGNMEAEIKGGGRDTFGFGFFATDYAVNKHKYQTEKKLNIKVSAIGLVMEESDLTEIGGFGIDENFASYMPSKDIPRPTYYDFIGVLIDYKSANITIKNTGYIVKVKLINEESNPEFFTVDLFINNENMRIQQLEKGMKVTGALWFQGEIS